MLAQRAALELPDGVALPGAVRLQADAEALAPGGYEGSVSARFGELAGEWPVALHRLPPWPEDELPYSLYATTWTRGEAMHARAQLWRDLGFNRVSPHLNGISRGMAGMLDIMAEHAVAE